MGETSVTAASAAAAEPRRTPAQQDGRLTRAARTRTAVVDALLTLNEQGQLRPTARDIAAEAGVSLRSLYVHFDDLEALFVAAAARYTERLADVVAPPLTDGTFADRLESFLDRRVRIHEFGGGVRRAAMLQEPFSPVLQQVLNSGRQALRADIGCCFVPEIDAATAAGGAEAAAGLTSGLDIATSPLTWESLRVHQGLSADAAAAQVRDMVVAFFAAWVPASAPGGDGSDSASDRSTSTTTTSPTVRP